MTTQDETQRIDELLPWYVSGRISAQDRATVETALARDPEMRRRLEITRAEMDEVVRLAESAPMPSRALGDRLFAAIEAEPVRRPGFSLAGLFERIGDALTGFGPRRLAYATAAALGLFVMQAGIIAHLVTDREAGGYTTASAPESPAATGTHVLVGFAPDATLAQVTALVQGVRGTIVDGPRPGGLWRVRLSSERLADAERDALIQRLRGDPAVRFVAPSS